MGGDDVEEAGEEVLGGGTPSHQSDPSPRGEDAPDLVKRGSFIRPEHRPEAGRDQVERTPTEGQIVASATRKSMLVMPAAAALSLATASIPELRSVAVTRPTGATRPAMVKDGVPVPQARSRTRSPDCGAAAVTKASVAPLLIAAIRGCQRRQASTV